jgi:hypothetical protein
LAYVIRVDITVPTEATDHVNAYLMVEKEMNYHAPLSEKSLIMGSALRTFLDYMAKIFNDVHLI